MVLFGGDDDADSDSSSSISSSPPMVLQGYGVRLDIKNMEYKSYDDNPTHNEKSETDDTTSDTNTTTTTKTHDTYLAGVRLATLEAKCFAHYSSSKQNYARETLTPSSSKQ